MNDGVYEPHYKIQHKLPIIFHLNTISSSKHRGFIHWHENMEFLYVNEGSLIIELNFQTLFANKGDIVIIPSCAVHEIHSKTEFASFYCVIPDYKFFDSFGVNSATLSFENIINDNELSKAFHTIIVEMENKQPYYQGQVTAAALSFYSILLRKYSTPLLINSDKKHMNIVKKAFIYIDKNFDKNISVDDLAEATSCSKYYFCHVFKKLTSMTPISYVNYIRCRKAYEILDSGKSNVTEAALNCGFTNMSHFTKTYRYYIGEAPSATMRLSK